MEGQKIRFSNIFWVVFIASVFVIISGTAIYLWQKSYSNEEKNQIIDSSNKNTNLEVLDLKKRLERAKAQGQPAANDNGEDEAISQEPLKYASLDYSLVLPSNWKGYSVKNKIHSWQYSGSSKVVEFGFEEDYLFGIFQINKEQWALVNKHEDIKPEFISENDQYVFAYLVYDNGISKQYSARIAEIPSIILTFKVN